MPAEAESTKITEPSGREPAAKENAGKILCRKCGSPNMRRRSATLRSYLTSFHPYTCGRCGHHDKVFRFSAATVVLITWWSLLITAAVWIWSNPNFLSFAPTAAGTTQQEQAEALARARTSGGGELSTFEQMMLKKPKAAMNNSVVLRLVKAQVPKEVILQMIRTSIADYDVGANAIIEMKESGVDQSIILAMIDASYATR